MKEIYRLKQVGIMNIGNEYVDEKHYKISDPIYYSIYSNGLVEIEKKYFKDTKEIPTIIEL
jgi:hypothetical protein